MNQNNDHDFQQFRGQFNDAMMPSDAFKTKMEKLLQSEQPVEAERISTVLSSPPKEPPATVVPPRRSHPLMIAAAVLTVFAVAVASVWVLSGDVLEGEHASAPSGIATIPADAPGTPGPGVQLTTERFLDWQAGDYIVGVYDDLLLSSRWESDDDASEVQVLTAQDATSGEILWQLEETDISNMTLSGNTLVGVQYQYETSDPRSNATRTLTAIELQTGTVMWQTELSTPGDSFDRATNGNPVVAGDKVVIAQSNGTVHAWDINSGDQVWQSTFDPGEGWETVATVGTAEAQAVTMRTVAATAWNDHIVVMNNDGFVHLFEPVNGEVVASHLVAPIGDIDLSVTRLELHPLPTGVLMNRDTLSPSGSAHTLIAFDPETWDSTWEREFNGQVQLDIADDGSIAVNSHVWEQYSAFLRFFGMGGYSTFQFSWIDGQTGEEILGTDRGKLEEPAVTKTDGTYACTRAEHAELICFDRNGTRHIIEQENWGDPQLLDGVLYIPTQDGLFRVELP